MREEGRDDPRDNITNLTGGVLGVQTQVTVSGLVQCLKVFKLMFWYPCDKDFTSDKQWAISLFLLMVFFSYISII